jgi:hypothetical protein
MLLCFVVLASLGIDWGSVKSPDKIELVYDREKWSKPVVLPAPVNTLGWEDSVEVSWEGDRLLFTYLRLDVWRDVTYRGTEGYVPRLDTPGRPQHPKTPAGAEYAADLYLATKAGDAWKAEKLSSNINTTTGLEGCASISSDRSWIVFRRSWTSNNTPQHACFYSRRIGFGWTQPTAFPAAINAPVPGIQAGDNPFLHKNEVYFEIETATNRKDFYSIPFTPWSKTEPTRKEVIGVNSADDETQLFITPDSQQTWFTRNSSVLCRKLMNGAVEYVVFSPSAGIGEPTIDKNGNLYFIYIFKATENGQNYYDADVIMLQPLR